MKVHQAVAPQPPMLPEEQKPPRPLLLYESNCPFCRRMAKVVAGLDTGGSLAILPYSHPDIARFVVFLTEEQVRESWRLYLPDGRKMTKGQALTALLELLPRTRYLGAFVRRARLVWLVGLIDAVISKLRPLLSRLVDKTTLPVERPL